jgi:transcription elongation factor Elf1
MGVLYTGIKHPTKDKVFHKPAYIECPKCKGKALVDGVKVVAGKAVAIYICKQCLKKTEVKLEK